MPKFRLAQTALWDMEDIHDYIATDSPKAADSFTALLVEKFLLLTVQPEIGRRRSELQIGIRSLPVKKYVIFYRVNNEVVEVIRILGGQRDIPALFN